MRHEYSDGHPVCFLNRWNVQNDEQYGKRQNGLFPLTWQFHFVLFIVHTVLLSAIVVLY